MANQIGYFFEAMPIRDKAVKDVATHIQNNWDPRMRSALLKYVQEMGDVELSTIVRDALPLLK
jgi:formate dehydrogenase subunit delta